MSKTFKLTLNNLFSYRLGLHAQTLILCKLELTNPYSTKLERVLELGAITYVLPILGDIIRLRRRTRKARSVSSMVGMVGIVVVLEVVSPELHAALWFKALWERISPPGPEVTRLVLM